MREYNCVTLLYSKEDARLLPFRMNSMSNYRQNCMLGSIVAFKLGYIYTNFGETCERKKKKKKKRKIDRKRTCTSASKVR